MEPAHLGSAYVAIVCISDWFLKLSILQNRHFLFSVLLSCNSTSSENNTYLFQSSSSSILSPCNYKICPCSTNICRIRYDFTVSTLHFKLFGNMSLALCSRNFQNVKLNGLTLLKFVPPLRFYAKSNFGEFKRSENVIFATFTGSEF